MLRAVCRSMSRTAYVRAGSALHTRTIARCAARSATAAAVPRAVACSARAIATAALRSVSGSSGGSGSGSGMGSPVTAKVAAAAYTSPQPPETDADRRKRLIYRAKQRGILELDLVMGSFAAAHVQAMSSAEVDEFERVVAQESPDLLLWLTRKERVPDDLNGPVMQRLLTYVQHQRKGWSPEARAEAKGKPGGAVMHNQ